MSRYVAGRKGYKFWRETKDCDHTNSNVCAFCDFDRFYANNYEGVPWADEGVTP